MANETKEINYNPPVPDIVRNYKNTDELGRIGQKKYAGIFFEEFLYELQGQKGIAAYREMSDNDDVVGAIMFAIEMLIRQVTWDVEAQGSGTADKKATEFVKSCLSDLNPSWEDTLSEILSFLPFGWSYHEIVYKRRMGKQTDPRLNSKYDDGLIGWRKLPIRAQDTLWRWEYDEFDELVGMSQMAPPDYQVRPIPLEKALHFRTKSNKNNPEGRSILRNAYRSHYFKKRIQEIEGIGIERDLAGLPMLTPPDGVNIWDPNDPDAQRSLTYAEKLVQNVRRDELEGLVIPFGWTFKLLTGESRRQFDTSKIIERYDTRIAMTVLADFVLLGHQAVGSFALSSDKTELFSVAIGTFLDVICEVFNTQGIPRLIDINGDKFKGITDYPKLVHGDLEEHNLTEFATFLEKMISTGIIVPDENLEQHVRRMGKLPDPVEGAPLPEPEPDEEEDPEDPENHPRTRRQQGVQERQSAKPRVNPKEEPGKETGASVTAKGGK